jgi:hypothetical protein
MPAKPKPTKEKKTSKGRQIICYECATISRKVAEHSPNCTQTLGVKQFQPKPKKTDAQLYEAALDHLCRLITTWRDGVTCVIHGEGCGSVSQWGHVIPQGSSTVLVHELSNSFRQSDTCNLLHRRVQAPYYDWYKAKFGNLAYTMLIEAWKKNVGKKHTSNELRDMVIQYAELYETRYSYLGLEDLVSAGFYGNIIKEAWIKEGRI